MKTKLLALIILIFELTAYCQTLPKINSTLDSVLTNYLNTHRLSPEQYILSKFDDHDVVFLGEFHKFKQNLELLQRLIPLLYKKGVHILGYEFARREDQRLIDSLLTSPKYDERLARLIIFNQYVLWPFKEYVDVFKVAWKLNRSLKPKMKPFRIFGLNNSPDWSLIKKPADLDDWHVLSKVWRGSTEADWGKLILDSVVAKGEKALIYSGTHHAFTEYHQPRVSNGKYAGPGDVRMGNVVFNAIGKRAITIAIHSPWYSSKGYDSSLVFPADGYIDAYFEKHKEFAPIGFDTKDSPFGKLPGKSSLYKYGYKNFTLDKFCDGYIYQCPFSQYKPVTLIKNFINKNNLKIARLQSPDPSLRKASAAEFQKDAGEDLNSQFKMLPEYK